VLEYGNRIGSHVRIHSGAFMELATIGDHVFVGPNVVFTDDPHPMGCPHYKDCRGGPVVASLARIGANATLLPGVRIGRNALVGAGSVVVRDVPADVVVGGNPATEIKKVADLRCSAGFFTRPFVWAPYNERESERE
jgi:acetyltransferase-like isoleucine patch superfamily enzyme